MLALCLVNLDLHQLGPLKLRLHTILALDNTLRVILGGFNK
jgi:hypothetical protein